MDKIIREVLKDFIFNKSNTHYSLTHLHNTVEVTYVKKGNLSISVDWKNYNLKNGDFVIIFPNQVHNYVDEYSPDNEYYTINITPETIVRYNNLFQTKIPLCAVCTPKTDTPALLTQIAYTAKCEGAPKDIIKNLITAIFGLLLENLKLIPNNISHDKITQILNYCNEHYKEEITGEKIADDLFISRSHISNLFNRKLGVSLRDYINSLRISDALNLMINKHIPITDAAYASGFSTLRTFNRAFKKQYGISPTEYLAGNTPPRKK